MKNIFGLMLNEGPFCLSALVMAVVMMASVLPKRARNNKKKTHKTGLGLLAVIFFSLLATVSAAAQETVTIPIDDLKQLRKLAADRDYQKGLADDAQARIAALQASSTDWQKLYLSEKNRADVVQGGRITENQGEIGDLKKANAALHDQHADDVRKIGELTFDLNKANRSKKYYFTGGFLAGAASGGYVAAKTCSRFGL